MNPPGFLVFLVDDDPSVRRGLTRHRGHMMEKLGVKSVAELVRLAEKAGVSSAKPKALSQSADGSDRRR